MEVSLTTAALLDERAHRAVEHRDLLREQVVHSRNGFRHQNRNLAFIPRSPTQVNTVAGAVING